jgi:hypothetical protein
MDREIALLIDDRIDESEARMLLGAITGHVRDTGVIVQEGETFRHGLWMVRFYEGEGGSLEIFEPDPAEPTKDRRGAAAALRFYRLTTDLCARFGARFDPPFAGQMAMLSTGISQGASVQGVRYPSPPHMSGWWVTSDEYDGNVGSLRADHLFHLIAARPDLVALLGMPAGWRFDTAASHSPWFDPEVAAASP